MKQKITIALSVLALTAGAARVSAQVFIDWQRSYGTAAPDELAGMVPTADGGFLMGVSVNSAASGDKSQGSRGESDMWIIKTDARGNIAWERTIGGSAGDDVSSIIQTPDGGYAILGNSSSGISGEKTDTARGALARGVRDPDYWVVKLNATGSIQWQKTLGSLNTERPAAIFTTADGGYIVGGHSRSPIGGDKTINRRASTAVYDFWILKLDNQGSILWQKVVGGNMDEYMASMVPTRDGGFIAGGYTQTSANGDKTDSSRYSFGVGSGPTDDYWIVKFDGNGNIQWNKTYGGSAKDALTKIIQTSDGGYLLGGNSESIMSYEKSEDVFSNNTVDYWVIKIDDTGAIQWDRTIGGTDIDEVKALVQTTDGGYLVGGNSRSGADGNKTTSGLGYDDMWLVKLNATGDISWQQTFGGDTTDILVSMAQLPDTTIAIAGKSRSGISGDKTSASRGGYDVWLLHLTKPCDERDTAKTHLTASVCAGDAYTLPSGRVVTGSGVFTDTLAGSFCDSFVVVTLNETAIDTTVSVNMVTLTSGAAGASYQWFDCATNALVPGATQQSFTASSNGRYAVAVTVNGCSDTSACYEITTTGISETGKRALVRIYPNPASGLVYVDAPFAVHVTVSTFEGKVVVHQDHAGMLSVAGLAEGIYLVRIADEAGVTVRTEKLVKIK